ncbi:MAG: GAF domain-containing sensor histidine kinase [Elusimicrobiota bacterium]
MIAEWTALALAVAAAAVGSYWALKFKKLLPLEAELGAERRRNEDGCAFAGELLQHQRLPTTPQSLSDALEYGVDRFLARFGGLELFVWSRRSPVGAFPETGPELVCRTGSLEAFDPRDLELPEALWTRVFKSPGGKRSSSPEGDGASGSPGMDVSHDPDAPGALIKAFGPRAGGLRIFPWGEVGRLWGVLGVVESGGADLGARAQHSSPPKLLAAYFGSMAERSMRFWELESQRERLEGGLSDTMRRLDETSLQLIRKAKEMKTLEEVVDAISEHPDEPEMLGAIVSMVAKALEADICAFLLIDEASADLVVQPGAYGLSEDEGSLYRIPLRNERSSSVRVFQSGEPFITGDAQSDPQVIGHYARLWKCHSLMVVPLSVEGRRLGVMRVGSFKRDFFVPEHMQFVRVIAEEAAVLVESALLSRRLAEANVELARLHRLKDDFVSTVSHEFKTPLTSIKGFLSVLLDGEAGELNGEQKRFLSIAMTASERLSALVSDMLDISRLEGGLVFERTSVDLADVARISVEAHEWTASEKKVQLEAEVPDGLPAVKGNAEFLRQVFDNLVSNAIKFTPAGGTVRVALSNKGECLQASVSDTGIGIPSAERDRVFERFYRASNRGTVSAPGTGLGLAICRSILEKHEGRIWVESVEDKGSTFHFVVPTWVPEAVPGEGGKA